MASGRQAISRFRARGPRRIVPPVSPPQASGPLDAAGAAPTASSGAGSRGSGPARICSSAAQSSTERAIGPMVSSVQLSRPVPCRLIRPWVTLSPTNPLKADGIRTEPPVSLPIPAGANPAATATAVPLEEPPGARCVAGSQGFHGVPISGLVPQAPKANSTMWVLPS